MEDSRLKNPFKPSNKDTSTDTDPAATQDKKTLPGDEKPGSTTNENEKADLYVFEKREWYVLQGVDKIGNISNAEILAADGLSVRVKWATINPQKDVFNFESIRTELERCKSQEKPMQLRVMSGPSAPAWLADEGVRYLDGIPHPQDDKVLDFWETLNKKLGQEFGSEKSISVVHASGITPGSAEWLYAAHTNLYSQPDFDGDKMVSQWNRAIEIQALAFPHAIISANLGDHGKDWVPKAIATLKKNFPEQSGFQINSLNAKEGHDSWIGFVNPKQAGSEGYHSGYQMVSGSPQDRFGGPWERMLGYISTTEAQWIEFYVVDIDQSMPD